MKLFDIHLDKIKQLTATDVPPAEIAAHLGVIEEELLADEDVQAAMLEGAREKALKLRQTRMREALSGNRMILDQMTSADVVRGRGQELLADYLSRTGRG